MIPPAWSAVWISPDPLGHIQVTGRDQRGRKQYRYHRRWREVRDELKYGKMLTFVRVLPLIRARVDADLRRHGLPCERVLAAIPGYELSNISTMPASVIRSAQLR